MQTQTLETGKREKRDCAMSAVKREKLGKQPLADTGPFEALYRPAPGQCFGDLRWIGMGLERAVVGRMGPGGMLLGWDLDQSSTSLRGKVLAPLS